MKHKWLFVLCAVAVVLSALALPCFAYPLNAGQGFYSLAPDRITLVSHDDISVGYGNARRDTFSVELYSSDIYSVWCGSLNDDDITTLELFNNAIGGEYEYFYEFSVSYPYMSLRPDESVSPVTTLVFSPVGGSGREVVNMYREYTFYYYNQSGELQSETYLESRTYNGELVNFPVPLVPSYTPNNVVGFELNVYGDTTESWSSLSFTEPDLSDTPYQYGPNLPEHNVTIVTSPNVFEWLSNSIGALLDTPIIGDPAGDYSYTIGNLLFLVVCIPLVVSFLKFFAGG